MQNQFSTTLKQAFLKQDTKFQSHLEFLILGCYQCHHHLCFARKGKMKLFLGEQFFSEKSVEIIMAEWKSFKFELIDIKKKYQLLNKILPAIL